MFESTRSWSSAMAKSVAVYSTWFCIQTAPFCVLFVFFSRLTLSTLWLINCRWDWQSWDVLKCVHTSSYTTVTFIRLISISSFLSLPWNSSYYGSAGPLCILLRCTFVFLTGLWMHESHLHMWTTSLNNGLRSLQFVWMILSKGFLAWWTTCLLTAILPSYFWSSISHYLRRIFIFICDWTLIQVA